MSSPLPPDPQAAQAGLALTLYDAIVALWPQLDLLNLRGSLPEFTAAVALEVQRHAQASATLAAQQYRHQRIAAGVGRGYTPIPSSPPPVEQIAQSVDWAVQPLWNSAVLGGPATEAEQAAGSAIADAKARLAASTERLVLDAGARTITANAERDQKARGYARIPEPGACYLCLMLASRGAVYKHDRAGRVSNGRSQRLLDMGIQRGEVHGNGDSFAASNARFVGSGTIKVHDHCQCHPEPVFGAYEPTARARAAEQLWIVAARGRSNKSARDAYRAAVDGTVNDKTGKPYFTSEQTARIAELRPQLGEKGRTARTQ